MKTEPAPGTRPADRIAAAFLLALMAFGTVVLWIGIPLGCLWIASKMVDSLGMHFVVSLPMVLGAMSIWAVGLFWVNRLYLQVTGFWAEPEDPDEPPRRIRGPLEPLLVGSLVLGIVALFVWFFFFAKNPSAQVI